MGKIQLTRADIKYIIERAKQAYVKYPDNGSYMKRGFATMFQVRTDISSHVLYTVLVAVFI